MTKATKDVSSMERIFKGWEPKDRIFILSSKETPITFQLNSRHRATNPLQYFDEALGYPRTLRYATNQSSIFEDEQEGAVVLGEILFEDGQLKVPARDVMLQKFLAIHPKNEANGGNMFKEFDPEIEARKRIEKVNKGFEAVHTAMSMDIGSLEAIARIKFPHRVDLMTASEIKYDVIQFAQQNPEEFDKLANNSNIQMVNLAQKAIKLGLIKIKDDSCTVVWKANGKEIVVLPFSANPVETLASWLKTNDGLKVVESISDKLS